MVYFWRAPGDRMELTDGDWGRRRLPARRRLRRRFDCARLLSPAVPRLFEPRGRRHFARDILLDSDRGGLSNFLFWAFFTLRVPLFAYSTVFYPSASRSLAPLTLPDFQLFLISLFFTPPCPAFRLFRCFLPLRVPRAPKGGCAASGLLLLRACQPCPPPNPPSRTSQRAS